MNRPLPKHTMGKLSAFSKKKEKLKYKLHFSSLKSYKEEKIKKQSAQALKFMRKLGVKLRKTLGLRFKDRSNKRYD